MPFDAPRYQVWQPPRGKLRLEAMTEAAAQPIADAMAEIDPWRTLGVGAETLAHGLLMKDDHLHRSAILHNDKLAGVVSVRNPWLFGPYLSLLAILPGHQQSGIGAAMLQWLEHEAGKSAGNVWACVSQFNHRARRFYARHGFEEIGVLGGLVRPEHDEVLIRKRLT
jgi:ribosomal protein S18 acetylase RimI-like enzyme